MKTRAIWLFISSFTFSPAMATDKSDTQDWEWHGIAESGAWLHTQKRGSTVRFNLELNRGAPSYNSGEMAGELTLNHYIGIYQPRDFPKCTLIFAFVGDAVEIQQLGSDSDCGFGFGVMASHVLVRVYVQSGSFPAN